MLYPVLRDMNNWLSNDFDDMFNTSWMPRMNVTAPAINVKETEKSYEVEVAAPGTTKDDFKVNVDKDGCLTIRMEHKSDKKDENKRSTTCAVSSHTATTSRLSRYPTMLRKTKSKQRLIMVCFM